MSAFEEQTMETEGNDWLTRFTGEQWMKAATLELRECLQALRAKRRRHGLANARRGAGMALNAVLLSHPDPSWGRSYVDHLRALSDDAAVPEVVRDSARELVEASPEGPALIRLGGADESLAAAAATIIDWAQARLAGEA